MIFYQLLERAESIHLQGIIHRDFKPDNLMFGLGEESSMLHLIDFGLSSSVINKSDGEHISPSACNSLVGTCRYMSINSHKGLSQSRRDDMISIGYVIINLFKGSLPW